MKSAQIRSFFRSVFSRTRTEYREMPYLSVFSPNARKYGSETTPYLDHFHAVLAATFSGITYFPFLSPILQVSPQWKRKWQQTTFRKDWTRFFKFFLYLSHFRSMFLFTWIFEKISEIKQQKRKPVYTSQVLNFWQKNFSKSTKKISGTMRS